MRAAKDGREAGRFSAPGQASLAQGQKRMRLCKSSPLAAMARHLSGATERWHTLSTRSVEAPPPWRIGKAGCLHRHASRIWMCASFHDSQKLSRTLFRGNPWGCTPKDAPDRWPRRKAGRRGARADSAVRSHFNNRAWQKCCKSGRGIRVRSVAGLFLPGWDAASDGLGRAPLPHEASPQKALPGPALRPA
jgi:hypothetical protein